jgi:hypothetical protein
MSASDGSGPSAAPKVPRRAGAWIVWLAGRVMFLTGFGFVVFLAHVLFYRKGPVPENYRIYFSESVALTVVGGIVLVIASLLRRHPSQALSVQRAALLAILDVLWEAFLLGTIGTGCIALVTAGSTVGDAGHFASLAVLSACASWICHRVGKRLEDRWQLEPS